MKSLSAVLLFAGSLLCSLPVFAEDKASHPVAATTILEDVAVRQAADDKSPTIETLKKGTVLTATDRSGAYWKVKLADGKEGFVSVTSLKTKGSVKDLVKGAVAPAPAAAPAAPAESNSKKLEKAASGLFKKK